MTIKRNSKVRVYLDPITVSDSEGRATVVDKPELSGDKDDKGRPIYRCLVRFQGEQESHHRWVSEESA